MRELGATGAAMGMAQLGGGALVFSVANDRRSEKRRQAPYPGGYAFDRNVVLIPRRDRVVFWARRNSFRTGSDWQSHGVAVIASAAVANVAVGG